MAESVVLFAAKHIESLNEADLFDVLSEAKAVQEELESIEKFMVQVRNNKEFLLWLPKLRRIAYDAEDVVDTYISDATSSTNLHRRLYKIFKAHYTSKKLHKLGKEMKDVKAKMQEQYVKEFPEKQKQGQTTEDSEKEKQGHMYSITESEKDQIESIEGSEEREIINMKMNNNYEDDIIEENSSTSSLADSVEDILEHVMTPTESKKAAGGRGSQYSKGHLLADDEFVVGIEKDVEDLVKSLTAGKTKNKESLVDDNLDIDVLAIAGMGGSGKTTLARNIYNNARVRKHFKYQAWVTLSQQWTASEVLSDISSQIHTNKHLIDSCQHNRESELDYLVRSCLRMKKCLIVLDDLWDLDSLHKLLPYLINCDYTNYNNNHQTVWDVCMNDNDDITKVVITSRYRFESSSMINNTNIKWRFHDMQLLSEKNGWDLFNKVSSNENGKELAREYSGLATEMLIKCGGLPLAIVALGKLLKTKDSIQGWERVYSLLVNEEGPNYLYLPVNDILALSYRDLQYRLKPCFLYFGLFPEDFQIKAGTLIRMWIAEGFVQKQRKDNNKINGNNNNNGESSCDDVKVARELLQKLIDHTMVQGVKKNYTGKVKTLRVHDIMRDLCIKEAQELDFLTVCSSQSDQFTTNTSRRAALNLSKCSTLPVENSHIRSLFLHEHEGVVKRGNKGKQKTVLLNLAIVCEKFKLLRVLDVNGISTSDGVMPRGIGNLIHLRYLRIRSTNIRELPRTIGKLRNLITLDYWDVSVDGCGIRLPNVLWKLRKLRYLYLPNEMSNTKESLKLRTMMELQTLWGVRGGNWMLKEMANLSTKLNKMSIQGISSLDQMMSVLNCGVITTHNRIYSLALDWYSFPINDLGKLSLNTSLKKLRLMGKANMPHSKPLIFPSKLEKLELYYTQLQRHESMEILGELSCLKCLILAKDSFIGKEWKVSKEKVLFQKLECLKLCELPNLEEWDVPKGSMPSLKKLSIICCTNLKQIPESLSSSNMIERFKIKRMPTNFNGNNPQLKNKDHVDTIANCNSYIFSRSYLIRCVKWFFLILGLLICMYYCVYRLAKYSGLVGERTWFKT